MDRRKRSGPAGTCPRAAIDSAPRTATAPCQRASVHGNAWWCRPRAGHACTPRMPGRTRVRQRRRRHRGGAVILKPARAESDSTTTNPPPGPRRDSLVRGDGDALRPTALLRSERPAAGLPGGQWAPLTAARLNRFSPTTAARCEPCGSTLHPDPLFRKAAARRAAGVTLADRLDVHAGRRLRGPPSEPSPPRGAGRRRPWRAPARDRRAAS